MPFRWSRLAALAALLALTLPGPAAAQGGPAGPERLFYYVDSERSYESFVRNADKITVLGPQVYTVDSLGIVFGDLDRRVLELAKRKGIKVMPLVVNEGFHQPSLRRLLADTAARARAVRSLVDLCTRHGYWGIQFDVENINIQDTHLFTAWYTEAARALHAAGCKISIAVVHRTEDYAGPTGYHRFLQDSWRAGFDLPAIAKVSDFVSVMSYDQHTRRTPPGPVAGLPWMRQVVDYFLRHVPPEKLSLGIPLYSERWHVRYDGSLATRAQSSSQTMSWAWGQGMVERAGTQVRWDEEQGVPWAYIEHGGVFEWFFLEDVRSFQAKLALMREKKLRGFSAWALGTEDERIWGEMK